MRFFLCLFYMFHRRYSNYRPLNSARYNRMICQTVENTSRHLLRGCRAYCTRWRKVTKVTNPISGFTFLSTAKSGKFRINKNRRKAIFNWAAKGLFFLKGGGGYTHSGYHKTLSATIACDRTPCEAET